MAFALTKYKQHGVGLSGPGERTTLGFVELEITGLTTDVDLDIGDDDGTFWTAALANSTYGAMAAQALSDLQDIVANADDLLAVKSQQLLDRVQAAAASGTAYTVGIEEKRPNITFAASNGETAYTIVLEYLMKEQASVQSKEYAP